MSKKIDEVSMLKNQIAEMDALAEKLLDAAEPFITFRKIQTYNLPAVWDVQLLERHLSNWNELVDILKARKQKKGQE